MKHVPLQKVIGQLASGRNCGLHERQPDTNQKPFWYVETHAARPYYFLVEGKDWQRGIGDLVDKEPLPPLLSEYHLVAYQNKQNVSSHSRTSEPILDQRLRYFTF